MIGRPIVLHHRQHRRKITQVVGRVLTFVGCRMEYTSGSKCIVLLAILLVSACGGGDKGVGSTEAAEPNQAPRAVEDIADQDMITGERDVALDLSEYFRDADGDNLAFTAESSDTSVAAVSTSGSTVTIQPISSGTATVAVTATDPGGLSDTQRFRVYVEAPGPPMTGPYEPLEWINVSPGRIVWRPLSSIPLTCLGWTEVTVNGATYRIHFSHWQRKQGSDRGWTDIPGTRRVRRLCGYTPIATGEYRLVMELSIDEVRGRYASSNVIVAFCDGSACRYFEL